MQFVNFIECTPSFFEPHSAWLSHGPFGMWIVRALEPRTIVELGTHHGFSYFCFCQAIKESGQTAECYAVDTWKGDVHAGHYDNSIFEDVKKRNTQYADFSTLLRKTFGEALADIEDGTIDLLHIDGRHFYDDVREDFESWCPKLSRRAVVLFHDTTVHERDFGVWKYWKEISSQRPHVNFEHQHGLGVLFWGEEVAKGLVPLIPLLSQPEGRAVISDLFEALGEAFVRQAQQKVSQTETSAHLAKLNTQIEEFSSEVGELKERITVFKQTLIEARRHPLRQLKNKIAFETLSALARASTPLSATAAAKLRQSAVAHDPDRDGP